MRRLSSLAPALLLVGCSAEPISPPEPAASAAILETNAPVGANVLERIVVIGASASDGFGVVAPIRINGTTTMQHVTLTDVLRATLHERDATITHCGGMYFFTDPLGIGATQIECALANEPTLVVAVDYLFWYGYGAVGPDGGPLRTQNDRLELLEVGLANLERLDVPIILGDFPDMSPAVGMMLQRSQMPPAPVLETLNDRLDEWTASHPNVTVVPLAELIETIRARRPLEVGEYTWPRAEVGDLIMFDRLHPSYKGLIATAQMVASALVSAQLVEPGTFDADPEGVAQRLRSSDAPGPTAPP